MKRIALVTGGNSGIGYATARLLIERGYQVFISGRDHEKLSEASRRLGAQSMIADMVDVSAINALASHFQETGLDVLVNNAGMSAYVPAGGYDEDSFDRHFYTNVRGPLFLIQELLPALEKREGSVVTVSSIIVTHGAAGAALYAATKGAVEAFTRSLALELAPRKIRVNAVAPGAIATPIFSKMGLTEEQLRQLSESFAGTIPLQRMGTPEDVAQVIVGQAEAAYVTGSVWTVDGGVDA